MTNFDKYHVIISYVPLQTSGKTEIDINGLTQSLNTYTGDYWVASMPEIQLSATGSTRSEAYFNLENLNDPSKSSPEQIRLYNQAPPLSQIRTW